MKSKWFIIILGACLLLNTACNDEFLEEKRDYSVFGPEDIFQDPNQANAVFGSIYKKILGNTALRCVVQIFLCGRHRIIWGANFMLTEELAVDIPLV